MSEPDDKKPRSMTVTIHTERALNTGKDSATRLNLPFSKTMPKGKTDKEGQK